mmetsp:Transcript_40570/g.126921  ORF Transcript_40570/g.126921 Transcript_40570/m.126921 type:complete len:386 (-) Transcript_40570:174-1331(-)|eukprot:CAMPEP_0118870438 /NCGR_PEP_ID=MMETSP1163-20130328/13394_1 /TAXON_ID=124430 /ORGANISM="Phaeomonas parva, Strain CCMP2877" /LENGTH=385 /DNA_ID=CAMNT_0006805443 /DNA_START=112 /DNA_END=1269 /DNA_ORIENTATION=-
MPRRTRAADPAQLTRFFDEPYGDVYDARTASRNSRGGSSYDPTMSWDGLSVDPRPFSRLDNRSQMTVGPRPNGVSGEQTIELSSVPVGGVFGNPARVAAPRAETLEQTSLSEALARSAAAEENIAPAGPCLSVTMRDAAPAEEGVGKRVVVMNDERFMNMGMRPPTLREVAIPAVVYRAGEHTDAILLHPHERRQIMELERDTTKARLLQRHGRNQRMRADYLLQKAHPSGVVAVDSAANPKTVTYRATAQRLKTKKDRKALHYSRRLENLSSILQPARRHGYNPYVHTAAPVQEKLFQTKGGPHPQEDNGARLFNRKGFTVDVPRQQYLRDHDLLGKNYNIVTHTVVETMPSTMAEVRDRRMAHPSQSRLERGRNLQGSLYEEY